jgi:hypothetical protein
VQDAAVYALRVPYDFPTVFARTRPAQIRAELEAHLDVLRDNDAARLILAEQLLPRSREVDMDNDVYQTHVDDVAGYVFDISMSQLANDKELEVSEFTDLVESVGDINGHLVVVRKLQTRPASRDRAFEIRYQHMML